MINKLKFIILLATICFSFTANAQHEFKSLSYNLNGWAVNGVKIKTKIPFTNGESMPTVILEGYNYGGGRSIGIIINWYVFYNKFINFGASSHGSYSPEIQLANEGGFVVIFINARDYFTRFQVRSYGKGFNSETAAIYENWTAVDEPVVGTNVVTVPYKTKIETQDKQWSENGTNIFYNKGNVGIGTTGAATGNLEVASNTGGVLSITTNKAFGTATAPLKSSLDFLGSGNNKRAQILATDKTFQDHASSLIFSVSTAQNNLVERLRIIHDGKVGIGTESPTAGLEVRDDTGININAKTNGGWPGNIQMSDALKTSNITAKDDMLFSTDGGFLFKMDRNKNGISDVQGFNIYDRSDKSVFTIEESNGRIGIGTTNLEAQLNIQNTTSSYGAILASGAETFKLYTRTFDRIPNTEVFRLGMKYDANFNTNGYISFYRGSSANDGYLGFSTSGVERMIINNQGNVAIGSNISNSYKLAVGGTITAEEIKVQLRQNGNWPDFVFEKDYKLPSLQEVENFVKQNGHLEGVPNTAEVTKEGFLLGEMNIKLLQKIEELTLYTIAQEKEINLLKEQSEVIKTLEKENILLKKLIHEVALLKAEIYTLKK